ncbi:MAG: hypothetical protein J6W82_02800 [Bacteroidales bacterium]|nr:hypothetical protein [Bacteroidales bacterium]
MLRTRLFCIISISLCALFSSRAQSLESQAVAYERIIYDGAPLDEVNAALLGKADCYMQLGRWREASETLARVRVFALLPEERHDLLYKQELCFFLGGEFGQAASFVSEVEPDSPEIMLLHALSLAYSGNYDESEIYAARYLSWDGPSPHLDALYKLYAGHPRERSQLASILLAMVPPLGHIYNGAPSEGLLSAGLNAGAVAFTVANLLGGYWVTGIVGGAIALNYTVMGSQERNAALLEKYKHNAPLEFGDKVREFLKSVSEQ